MSSYFYETETNRELRIASLEEEITYCEEISSRPWSEEGSIDVPGGPYDLSEYGQIYLLSDNGRIEILLEHSTRYGLFDLEVLCERALYFGDWEARASCLREYLKKKKEHENEI